MDQPSKHALFYWLFDPRFDPLLDEFQRYLETSRDKAYSPLIVRAYECLVPPPGQLYTLGRSTASEIYQEEPEDLNVLFSRALQHESFHQALVERQGSVDFLSFTNEHLPDIPGLKPFGAAPAIADRLNSKTFQHALFNKIDVPQPRSMTFATFNEVQEHCDTALEALSDFVLKPACSAGGWKTAIISSPGDLPAYKQAIPPADLNCSFLASELVDVAMAPAVLGAITPDGRVFCLAIVDQVVQGFSFIGDIYPSFVDQETQQELYAITERIGREMAANSYQGFFGVDFVLDSQGRAIATEINARFTFGAIVLVRAFSGNIFSIAQGDCKDHDTMLSMRPEPTERLLISKIPLPRAGHGTASHQNAATALTEDINLFWPPNVAIRQGSYRGLATSTFSMETDYDDIVAYVDALRGVS